MDTTTAPAGTARPFLAWALAAVCTACSLTGLALEWVTRSSPAQLDFGSRASGNATAFAFMVLPLVGALVATRRPGSPIGWLFIGIGATMAVWVLADGAAISTLAHRPGSIPGGRWFAWVADWIWIPGWGLTGLVFLLFPTGHLPGARWRAVTWALIAVTAVYSAAAALGRGRLANYAMVPNPAGAVDLPWSADGVHVVGVLAMAAVGVPAIASLVVRRRHAVGDERHQVNWLLWSASVVVGAIVTFAVLRLLGGRVAWAESWVLTVGALVPLAAGIALLKYRLYGIDLVISRTIVFGALAAFVTLIYTVVVVGVGDVLHLPRARNPGLSIVATALVAVTFDPARSRAQRLANRVVYGERATPYEVLSGFSARVSGEYAAEDALPRMAAVIAEGVGAREASVWLNFDGRLQRAGRWGPPGPGGGDSVPSPPDGALPSLPDAGEAFPIRHEGELLGAVTVAMAPDDRLSPSQERLVTHLASQAALVLRNVRLIAELRASRQRIVAAGDAERRRLERNIHDGAQQQLVALTMKLRLAADIVGENPEARALVDDLRTEALDALADLRDLARGIYPPLLADAGLVQALRAQAAKAPVATEVEDQGVRRYGQDVEAAVYFCSMEAMQNVAKYAGATSVLVRLEADDRHLTFTVIDDGRGFDPATRPGSGLRNMADRVEALGGTLDLRSAPGKGTTVVGRVPVEPVDPAGHPDAAVTPSPPPPRATPEPAAVAEPA